MKRKEYIFEDFTLIMTRNCNLSCEYCPLDHFIGNISNEILEIFFKKIIDYANFNLFITLFGGEPLVNRKGIYYIYDLLYNNTDIYKKNNIYITLKIVSNGTLLDNDYINLFEKIKSLGFVILIFNISIDGNKETQLKQRNYKIGYVDYYDRLRNNIHNLISSGIQVELGMVMSFFNDNLFENIIFLIKEFKLRVFIMPVDLTLNYIIKNKYIYKDIRMYLQNIGKVLKLLENNNLTKYIVNYCNEYRDIKIPPIGPTIDINGDLYTTRDFLFTMDKSIDFPIIGNIKKNNLIDYFLENYIKEIEQDTLKLYYGKTIGINKKIGDYFTKLVYKK